jgi:hypothetical protein
MVKNAGLFYLPCFFAAQILRTYVCLKSATEKWMNSFQLLKIFLNLVSSKNFSLLEPNNIFSAIIRRKISKYLISLTNISPSNQECFLRSYNEKIPDIISH